MNAQQTSRLEWPPGEERTPAEDREPYPHGFRVSRNAAFDSILEELRKMDARNVQLDTGARHQKTNPNMPYADSDFDDPGVVVRFEREGQQYCIAMDQWDCPRDNAQSIAKTLKAKRALTRYGVETVESEYQTMALPSADVVGDEPAHVVLGVDRDATEEEIKDAARQRSVETHPDLGGDKEAFKRVQKAKEVLLG